MSDWKIKLLLIGDSAVGKTSLLMRYTNDKFNPNFLSTIGIDHQVKTIQLPRQSDSQDDEEEEEEHYCRVRLDIWDTAGQERFRTITRTYYRGAHGILLVYDITDCRSFEAVRHWMSQVRDHASLHVDIVLVGNKCDCQTDKRVVAKEEGSKLATECGATFVECSARANINVYQAFEELASTIKERFVQNSSKEHKGGGKERFVVVDRFVPTVSRHKRQCW